MVLGAPLGRPTTDNPTNVFSLKQIRFAVFIFLCVLSFGDRFFAWDATDQQQHWDGISQLSVLLGFFFSPAPNTRLLVVDYG